MVQLLDSDIKTREVLTWQGLHFLYHAASSCSKKVRLFLNLKSAVWESHIVDVMHGENFEDWFMGINPRGLVPVLVDDGAVHIESNDILLHLEEKFPLPQLIPDGNKARMAELLRHEDELHLDLRTLTVRFLFVGKDPPKRPGALEQYRKAGSGTVQGRQDAEKAVQIDFWESVAREGISDEAVRCSVRRFFDAFSALEDGLGDGLYLVAGRLSLLDIAWFIYTDRLIAAGYPISSAHPKIDRWYRNLCRLPEFAQEVTPAPRHRGHNELARPGTNATRTLSEIAGF